MFKLEYKILLVDIVLVVALYSVLQDLQWRTSYAASLHDACGGLCSYAPSFGYGVFTRVFTLSGNGVRLASPPMVDWVQILVVLLVLVNGWYLYVVLRAKKPQSTTLPS
jgi:hypothetical protein